MNTDPYAQNAPIRFRKYAEAFDSAEAKAWIASLSPEQRKLAEEKGLLVPLSDHDSHELPIEEEHVGNPLISEASMDALIRLFEANPLKLRALNSLMHSKKYGAELKWAALRYLCGEGTCQSHAIRFGMTRQNFHAVVKKFKALLWSLHKPQSENF